jgi:hypothetical protein
MEFCESTGRAVEGRPLTRSKSMPNKKKKRRGPARSASSIICSSTRWSGLRTVMDLARICEKLMPSSAGLVWNGHVRVDRSPYLVVMEARLRIHRCQRQSTNRRAAEWSRRTSERRFQMALRLRCPCCLLSLNASQDRTGPGQSVRRRTGGVHFAGPVGNKDCARKTRHNDCSSLATSRSWLWSWYNVGTCRNPPCVYALFTMASPSPLLCSFTDTTDSRRYFGCDRKAFAQSDLHVVERIHRGTYQTARQTTRLL